MSSEHEGQGPNKEDSALAVDHPESTRLIADGIAVGRHHWQPHQLLLAVLGYL
jgi:hypothetical protein